MTTRAGGPACDVPALESAAGVVVDGDLRAQWKAIVAVLRANRETVMVLTVGPRARSAARTAKSTA